MSVASFLDKKALNPDTLYTKTTLTMEGGAISAIHLLISGFVKDMEADAFAVDVKEVEQNGIVFSYTDENNSKFNIEVV